MGSRPAGLADELELGQSLDHGTRQSRALLSEHNNIGVFQALSEASGILFSVVVNHHLMALELWVAPQRTKRVLIIVNDCNLHRRLFLPIIKIGSSSRPS